MAEYTAAFVEPTDMTAAIAAAAAQPVAFKTNMVSPFPGVGLRLKQGRNDFVPAVSGPDGEVASLVARQVCAASHSAPADGSP